MYMQLKRLGGVFSPLQLCRILGYRAHILLTNNHRARFATIKTFLLGELYFSRIKRWNYFNSGSRVGCLTDQVVVEIKLTL